MGALLFTIPLFPLLGFLLLAFLGRRLDRGLVALVGAGSIGASAFITLLFLASFLLGGSRDISHTVCNWISVGDFQSNVAFHLDPLSLLMCFVITGVGFLIHVYSIEYMIDDKSYARFFACMNLFVCSMLILVLADNLLLLFLGWEAVGLCSWLLIGFWYEEPDNVRAANKAFIVTRMGDVSMMLGIFLLFQGTSSLHIDSVLEVATLYSGSNTLMIAAALLLGGAIGKSGQLPLQVWLPDAMAGPTPVSALIHAATMVTAGVYLIARMHPLFEAAPQVMQLIAGIGVATLLVAGIAALAQRDIKRALAYSTISQLGYMFLALGVGAWSAAMFHFMTHAFFKALLFMSAGWIIVSLHHEQDMTKMGGLRREMPTAFWSFTIGALSLMAFPIISSGFYSKDMILWHVYAGEHGSSFLWLLGVIGAFITTLYTMRMVMLVFFGKGHGHTGAQPGNYMRVPLILLAVLATIGGFVEIPAPLGGVTLFSDFVFGEQAHHPHGEPGEELGVQLLTALVVLAGIATAWLLYGPLRRATFAIASAPPGRWLHGLLARGIGFDALYHAFIVAPYRGIAWLNRGDLLNGLVLATSGGSMLAHRVLSRTQSGVMRWYMMAIALGALITIAVAVFA